VIAGRRAARRAAPRPQVLLLSGGRNVETDPRLSQRKSSNGRVDVLGNAEHSGWMALSSSVFDRCCVGGAEFEEAEGNGGKGDVHDGRRVPLGRGKIHHAALCDQQNFLPAGQ
jgi:hypothetical protein